LDEGLAPRPADRSPSRPGSFYARHNGPPPSLKWRQTGPSGPHSAHAISGRKCPRDPLPLCQSECPTWSASLRWSDPASNGFEYPANRAGRLLQCPSDVAAEDQAAQKAAEKTGSNDARVRKAIHPARGLDPSRRTDQSFADGNADEGRPQDAGSNTKLSARIQTRSRSPRVRSSPNRSVAQIARVLGVSDNSLRNWVKQTEIDQGEREGLTTEERDELGKLRKEVKVLR